jgi:hypothetical protein
MKHLGRMILGTFLLLSLAATLGWAEDDPPGRVARLQYMTGSVSVQPRGTEDWVEGSLNRPLTTADNIWADKESRAELSLGTAVLRINSETSMTLTSISDNLVQVQLHQGALNLRVRKLYGGEIYEVDTPNIAFTVQKSGVYRFDVGPEGDATLVTVTKGEGDATGEGPSVRVRAHERARFTSGTSLAHEISQAPAPDGFDDWARVRDQREDHSYSAQYVSRDTIGYEDLDEYGSWRTVPAYGPVWVPTAVSPGWAPYRYGHWVWVSPWGWTWVDDAPWGFAPFHYGRWVYYGGYWGWAPGPFYGRPIYAPALVAWFGGPRWGVSIGFGGGYGWCPLGFGEPFFPWYGGSRNYFRNVNIRNTRIVNITNITNNYYNGRGPRKAWPVRYTHFNSPGGLTAVSQRTIVNSLPVSRSMVSVSAKEFTNARIDGKVDLAPTRDSRLGNNSGRPAAIPPQRTFARPVVSKIAPMQTPMRGGRTEEGSINRGAQPVTARPAERPTAASSPGSGRFVPRPGVRAETRQDATPVHTAPGSPAMNRPASPAAQTSPGRTVPRPPERNRAGDDGRSNAPAPGVSGRGLPEAGERTPVARPSPTMRPVPRPSEGMPSGADGQPGARTHEAPRRDMPEVDRAPAPRPAPSAQPTREPASGNRTTPPSVEQRSAPREPANRQPPSSDRPNVAQRNVPRTPQGSTHGSTATRGVPRPTGQVRPASYRSPEAPRSSARSSASTSRGSYGRSERSYGSFPRYSAPAPSRSASQHGSAPSYHGSAPPSHGSSQSSHGSSHSSSHGSSHSSSGSHSGRRS